MCPHQGGKYNFKGDALYMNKRKISTAVLVIIILVTLTFIWGNSLKSIPESSALSGKALNVVGPFLEIFVGAGKVTDHLVRKIAHFVEYFILGLELSLLMMARRDVCLQGVINCLSAGLAAAVTDESIQIISARGSQVIDVLLDFCGVLSGVAITLLVYSLTKPGSRRKSHR